jgi:CSLREA domain-containing protein
MWAVKKYTVFFLLAILLSACSNNQTVENPIPDVPPQSVDTWHVTTYLDTFDKNCSVDDCSLRDAVYQANRAGRSITIYLPGGLHVLNNMKNGGIEDDTAIYGDLDVSGQITIVGDGINVSNISAGHRDRIFHVMPEGSLALQNLTLINGRAWDNEWTKEVSWLKFPCASITPWSRSFAVLDEAKINCEWNPENNVVTLGGYERKLQDIGGGAIAVRGDLRLTDVSIGHSSTKSGGGGAIRNLGGKVVIVGGFLCDNSAERGGAIYNISGRLELFQVGICNNESTGRGSAIYSKPSDWTETFSNDQSIYMENVTFANHKGADADGVIYLVDSQTILNHVTVNDNDPIGVVVEKGKLSVQNSILANNGSRNCQGSVTSLGNNLETGNTCSFNPANGDLLVQDAGLAALNGLGGFFPLKESSPAIDAGNDSACAPIDQRKESRPSGFACDIGAFELQDFVSQNQSEAAQPADSNAPEDPSPTSAPSNLTAPTNTPTATSDSQEIVTPLPDTPTFTPTPTPSATPLPPDPMNASISGFIWQDAANFGNKDGGELTIGFQSVQLGAGACSSSGLANQSSNLGGFYSFTGLAAGIYCVSVDRPEVCDHFSTPTTATSQTVTLGIGESAELLFGYRKTNCVD